MAAILHRITAPRLGQLEDKNKKDIEAHEQ